VEVNKLVGNASRVLTRSGVDGTVAVEVVRPAGDAEAVGDASADAVTVEDGVGVELRVTVTVCVTLGVAVRVGVIVADGATVSSCQAGAAMASKCISKEEIPSSPILACFMHNRIRMKHTDHTTHLVKEVLRNERW